MTETPTNLQAPSSVPNNGDPGFWSGVALLVLGAWMYSYVGGGTVTQVLVTKSGGLPELRFFDAPDYYVMVFLKGDQTVKTPSYNGVPIGNGLKFQLPAPAELSQIENVCLVNANVVVDDEMVDQVAVHGRQAKGQAYTFELVGPQPMLGRYLAVASIVFGGYLILEAIIKYVRRQAV